MEEKQERVSVMVLQHISERRDLLTPPAVEWDCVGGAQHPASPLIGQQRVTWVAPHLRSRQAALLPPAG